MNCPHCNSKNLRYVQRVYEWHEFDNDQWPSEDGYIDLLHLEETFNDDEMEPYIFCCSCTLKFDLNGKLK